MCIKKIIGKTVLRNNLQQIEKGNGIYFWASFLSLRPDVAWVRLVRGKHVRIIRIEKKPV